MRKFFKFTSLLLLPTISVATLATSCSSNTKNYSNLNWADKFNVSSKKEEINLKGVAITHIQLTSIYPTNVKKDKAQDYINSKTNNDTFMLNYTLYWEWIYNMCLLIEANKIATFGCESWTDSIPDKDNQSVKINYWAIDNSKTKSIINTTFKHLSYVFTNDKIQISLIQGDSVTSITWNNCYRFSNISIIE